MMDSSAHAPSIRVLGVRVHLLKMDEVLDVVDQWIQSREGARYVVATGMHGVVEAHRQPDFKTIVNSADLFVPDGISLVWIARLRGFPIRKRVCGSDLMWEFFKRAEDQGYRSFFYGDTEDTLELLTFKLKEAFPRLKIAGVHSPPFRQLTSEEEEREINLINESGADILWVGLGLPKQERWMFEHKDQLKVPVMVGVGAAFKFLSGKAKRAPGPLGDRGMEWLWRFIHEPRQVWRRVLFDGPRFICLVLLELTGLKKFT